MEKEKKENKVLGYILSVLLCLSFGFFGAWYLTGGYHIFGSSYSYADTPKIENANTKIVEPTEKATSNVPTTDLVTLFYSTSGEQKDIFYAYISDGNLYYIKDTKVNTIISGNEMKKYEALSDIKRIKQYNFGTSVMPEIFLITEDGKVYSAVVFGDGVGENPEFKLVEAFQDYKVEDITNMEGEMESTYTLLLQDGTTVTVKR